MSPLGKIHVLEVTDNAGHDEVARSTLKHVGKLKNGDVSRVCVPLLRLHNRRTRAAGKTGKSYDSPRSRSQHTESITRAPQMGSGAHTEPLDSMLASSLATDGFSATQSTRIGAMVLTAGARGAAFSGLEAARRSPTDHATFCCCVCARPAPRHAPRASR